MDAMSNELVVTPDDWCTLCGEYRRGEADGCYGTLCPVCRDKTPVQQAATRAEVITEMRTEMRAFGVSAEQAAVAMQSVVRGTVTEEHTDAEGNRVIDGLTLDSIELRPIRAPRPELDEWHPHRWHDRTCRTYATFVISDCECGGSQRAYDAWRREQRPWHWRYRDVGPADLCHCSIDADHNDPAAGVIDD
jgi:hypothetical protein